MSISQDVPGELASGTAGVSIRTNQGRGYTELIAQMVAPPSEAAGNANAPGTVMVELMFESGQADVPAHAFSGEHLIEVYVMIVADSPTGEPPQVWLNDFDAEPNATLTHWHLDGDTLDVAGTFADTQLCLYTFAGDEPKRVNPDDPATCRTVDVTLAIGSIPADGADDATTEPAAAPPVATVSVEVLGTLQGTMDGKPMEWLALMPPEQAASASGRLQDNGLWTLTIQGHDPKHVNWPHAHVLILDTVDALDPTSSIATETAVRLDYVLSVNADHEPNERYSSNAGRGMAWAQWTTLPLDAGQTWNAVQAEVSARLCREVRRDGSWHDVPDDCRDIVLDIDTDVQTSPLP